jgi:hypothetical protein
LSGLHGGFFYITMRRWIYDQDVYSETTQQGYSDLLVRYRVHAYLQASRELFSPSPAASVGKAAVKKPKTTTRLKSV